MRNIHSGNNVGHSYKMGGGSQRRLDKAMYTKYQIVELAKENLPIDLL